MGQEPTRLARRLGLGDAVVIGLGAMLGAGIFGAVGPAAAAAGGGLLVGLAIAGAVAACNALSSAQLAAVYPTSGGTYAYGRARLGAFWGYLAGWSFLVGKTASCAAMALTFAAYAAPRWPRPVAILAVVVLTALNYRGVRKTVSATRVILAVVLASLLVVVLGSLFGGEASSSNVGPMLSHGWSGIFEAAGLLFFALAGYARIATLGEEVVDPSRTIPRAIPLAFGVTLAVYAVVLASVLLAVGPSTLASSSAPLVSAVQGGSLHWLTPAVRAGGTVASLGVLLSLIVGVSRTTFAMAANGDLPRWLSAVHPRHRVPHHAEVAVGTLVVAIVSVADLRGAIGFSAFAVLTYYAITGAAAWTLPPRERRAPRGFAVAGLAGSLALAFTLPSCSVVAGAAVLAVGSGVWLVRRAIGPG